MRTSAVLIIAENLPVPLDRRVWQESCALRDAGYEVVVICPRMRDYSHSEEKLEGIQIYRHRISGEAGGLTGYLLEYATALVGETRLAWKAWWRHRFRIIHLCNPPDLLFLVAWPFRVVGARVIYDVHDLWPEMFEAKFGRRGPLYWGVRLAERITYRCADVVLATNESVRAVAARRGKKSSERIFVVRTAPKIADLNLPADPELRRGRKYLVGYIGVMGDADGVEYILEGAAHLVHRLGRRDVQFLLMGTGPEHERLVQQRDECGLRDFVEMPGRVSNEFLFRALRTDYMAFGKAQVMFDLKEGRATAAGAAAYVADNSAAQLAQTILELLGDPARRERMGRIGEERIRKELPWEKSVDHLLRAYEAALQEKRSLRRVAERPGRCD